MSNDCKEVPEFVQGEKIRLLADMIDEDNKALDISGATKIQFLAPSAIKGEFIRKTDTDATDPITVVGTTQARVIFSSTESKSILPEPRLTCYFIVDFADSKGRVVRKIKDAFSVCALNFDLDS